jgi:hypothetical protein
MSCCGITQPLNLKINLTFLLAFLGEDKMVKNHDEMFTVVMRNVIQLKGNKLAAGFRHN